MVYYYYHHHPHHHRCYYCYYLIIERHIQKLKWEHYKSGWHVSVHRDEGSRILEFVCGHRVDGQWSDADHLFEQLTNTVAHTILSVSNPGSSQIHSYC